MFVLRRPGLGRGTDTGAALRSRVPTRGPYRRRPHADLHPARHTGPGRPAGQRHLWLIGALHWVRGDRSRCRRPVSARVRCFLDAVQARPHRAGALASVVAAASSTRSTVTPLLADYGFAPRTAFLSEFGEPPAPKGAAGHARDHRHGRAVRSAAARALRRSLAQGARQRHARAPARPADRGAHRRDPGRRLARRFTGRPH